MADTRGMLATPPRVPCVKCPWLLGFAGYESWLRSAFPAATIRYDRLIFKRFRRFTCIHYARTPNNEYGGRQRASPAGA